jgi:hypothetical protein
MHLSFATASNCMSNQMKDEMEKGITMLEGMNNLVKGEMLTISTHTQIQLTIFQFEYSTKRIFLNLKSLPKWWREISRHVEMREKRFQC